MTEAKILTPEFRQENEITRSKDMQKFGFSSYCESACSSVLSIFNWIVYIL